MSKNNSEREAIVVNLRRMYVDCRYGQLHVRSAFGSTGGFDELTPLVCLHDAPMSGGVFDALLPLLGTDRSVYAPDLPGFGESDPPQDPPSVADYAAAVGDFLDQLRLRQVDVLGCQVGAAIAAELAVARPAQVRRVVMVGAPVFDEAEREAFRLQPGPPVVRQDGAHLVEAWKKSLRRRGPGASLEQAASDFAEALRNDWHAAWAMRAVMDYPATRRLKQVTQPVLVLRPHDELWEVTPRASDLLPEASLVELPDLGCGLFDTAADVVAGHVRAFLD